MLNVAKFLTAAAAAGALAAPAAAQYPYQQQYPQTQYPQTQYPQSQYPQQYPQTSPAYPQQGYGNNAVGQVIDQLLGNRYNVTDRQAIHQCARAAMSQASAQYGAQYGGAYNQQRYGYNQQQYGYNGMHVTAITDVQRRSNGLRVSGMLGSGSGYGNHGYGNQGYGNQGYNGYAGGVGDLSFRCNVDYRGAVTNVRVGPNNGYRHY